MISLITHRVMNKCRNSIDKSVTWFKIGARNNRIETAIDRHKTRRNCRLPYISFNTKTSDKLDKLTDYNETLKYNNKQNRKLHNF